MTDSEIIEEVAGIVDGKIRTNYSGRGMYGKSCYGIVCDSPGDCIEEAAAHGLRKARTDDMGLQYIVYWPHVSVV